MSGFLWARRHSAAPDIAGFRVQTSVYGLPIPIVYGTARVAANLIEYTAGTATPTTQAHSKWTPSVQTGWNYTAAVKLALAEGPIAGINNTWADKEAAQAFSVLAAAGWSVQLGGSAQNPYQLTAYVSHAALSVPNNVLPNFSWEVQGLNIFGGGVVDASMKDVIVDLLTNADHGVGFPSAALDSLASFADYVAAYGLFASPVLNAQQPIRQTLDDFVRFANSAIVWSDGLLKIIPYGDTAKTANGHTFTPNTTPVYDLTDNDYLAPAKTPPVTVTRKDPADCFNIVTVEFENRANNYQIETSEAKADDAIRRFGPLPMPKVSMPWIKDRAVADVVALQLLQREQYIRNTYGFSLGWKFSLLEPMDLVTLTDITLGLSLTPVRLTDVVELEDAKGIQCTAEDWPFGTATATLYPSQTGSPFVPNMNVAPGNTVVQVADAPAAHTQDYLEFWIGASGGSNWGGCDVYFSTDNVSYSKIGTIRSKGTFGALTANIATNAVYPTVDNTHTLSVDVTTSAGSIVGVSAADFAAEIPLVWVDGEFVIFQNASLTSAFHYDLTSLGRGMYGSPVGAHVSTAPFLVCDGSIFKFQYPGGVQGQTVYFKFPAFNVYGNALQSLGSVSAVSHVIGVANSLPGSAAAQGTVSIDSNGTTSVSADGGGGARSYKYSFATHSPDGADHYPTDASVIAGGTVVNGRTFSVIGAATLTFGDTFYITIIPYTGLSGSGIALPSIHLRGSFQTFSATKTVSYPANSFTELTSPPRGLSWDVDYNVLAPSLAAGNQEFIGSLLAIANGVTITQIDFQIFGGSGGLGIPAHIVCSLVRMAGNTSTTLGTNTAASTGWQTVSIGSLSELVSGYAYQANVTIANFASGVKIGNVVVTYTMPDPKKSQ